MDSTKRITHIKDFKSGYLYKDISCVDGTYTIDICLDATSATAKFRVVRVDVNRVIEIGTEYNIRANAISEYNIYEVGPYEEHAELLI